MIGELELEKLGCSYPLSILDQKANFSRPFTPPQQTNCHKPLFTIPLPRPVRPQEIPNITSHSRPPELDRRTKRTSRPGQARHREPHTTTSHLSLPPHAELAGPQYRLFLRDELGIRQRVVSGSVGRVLRAERRRGRRRVWVEERKHVQRIRRAIQGRT